MAVNVKCLIGINSRLHLILHSLAYELFLFILKLQPFSLSLLNILSKLSILVSMFLPMVLLPSLFSLSTPLRCTLQESRDKMGKINCGISLHLNERTEWDYWVPPEALLIFQHSNRTAFCIRYLHRPKQDGSWSWITSREGVKTARNPANQLTTKTSFEKLSADDAAYPDSILVPLVVVSSPALIFTWQIVAGTERLLSWLSPSPVTSLVRFGGFVDCN